MNVPFTDRTLRASWQQIVLYASALVIAAEPWTTANLAPEAQKYVELAKIILGVFVASGARSFIGRKDWTHEERIDKTLAKGEATPPSK